jgi:hypothetical protein
METFDREIERVIGAMADHGDHFRYPDLKDPEEDQLIAERVVWGDDVLSALDALDQLSRHWSGLDPDGAFVQVVGYRGAPLFPLHLRDMLLLHVKRNRAYVGTTDPDPLANYVRAGAVIGVPGWKAALMRMGEKMARLSNVAIHPENVDEESVMDTALDIAVIALLFLDLHRTNR